MLKKSSHWNGAKISVLAHQLIVTVIVTLQYQAILLAL